MPVRNVTPLKKSAFDEKKIGCSDRNLVGSRDGIRVNRDILRVSVKILP